MPMVRAMRLLGSIESGTTSGAQLETLISADAGRRSELNVLMNMRGQAERMAVASTTMAAIASSTTAAGLAVGAAATRDAMAISDIAKSAMAGTATGRAAVMTRRESSRTFARSMVAAACASYVADFVWTARSAATTTGSWTGVAYGNGRFVVVSSSTNAAVSTDGITWTGVTLPATAAGIAFNAGLFVIVVSASSTAYSSPDGVTWTSRTLSGNTSWKGVVPTTYGFTAFSTSNNATSRSADGVTWSSCGPTPGAFSWQAGAYGNGVVLVVAANDTTVAKSTNEGQSWTSSNINTSRAWKAIAYGAGLFVALASNTNYYATTPNGDTWTQRTLPTTANWQGLAYGGGMFVAVGISMSSVYTSTDGINWTARALPASQLLMAVAYGDGMFAAPDGSASSVLTSL